MPNTSAAGNPAKTSGEASSFEPRMPLPMIGDLENAHYNNVEAMDLDYSKHTISPWTIRIAQEVKRKLLGDGELFAEHVMEALLRGDTAAQSAFNTAMFRIGSINRNCSAAWRK